MYLTEVNLTQTVKKQYQHKLHAYMGFFLPLIVLQLFSLLFSLGGIYGSYSMIDSLEFQLRGYSGEVLIVFTFLWMFAIAAILTSKDYKDADFTFVTNRLSSNLSNLCFLGTAAAIGAVTASLGGALLRVIVFLTSDTTIFIRDGFFISLTDHLLFIITMALYLLLLSGAGYFIGVLSELHPSLKVILPVLFFGLWSMVAIRIFEHSALGFFFGETSLPLLAGKILLTAAVLYGCAFLLADRLEVRK